ncbi:MAG: PQQ-binding-like beta-propeller repeat protein [Verrucomicrobiota bacterium]
MRLRARLPLLSLGFALAVSGLGILRADDWPQWRGTTRDGVWRETGIVEAFASKELKPVWVAEVGPGFAGPTVAGDQVFLMDRVAAPEQERVLSFDRTTGKLRWEHAYPCVYRDVDYAQGPRAAVTVADGRAFSYGTMGHARAFEAATGRVLWARDMMADFKTSVNYWGMNSAPLVAGDVVIYHVGGEPDACLVALDMQTGKERWRALDGKASYSPPRLIRVGERDVVLAWTGSWLAGLNPATGEVLWKEPHRNTRMIHHVADPVLDETGRKLVLASFYDGTACFALKTAGGAPEELWHRTGPNERKTEAIHTISMTPLVRGGYIYGIHSYGELRCLSLETGEKMWDDKTLQPNERWATAHLVQNGDRTWISTEAGELVIARLSGKGMEQISRAKFITPNTNIIGRNEPVTWAHPAYANRNLYARSDSELVCISLAAEK